MRNFTQPPAPLAVYKRTAKCGSISHDYNAPEMVVAIRALYLNYSKPLSNFLMLLSILGNKATDEFLARNESAIACVCLEVVARYEGSIRTPIIGGVSSYLGI